MRTGLILFLLFALFSCGSKEVTRVDTTIVMTNALTSVAGQTGGVVLYGRNKDAENDYLVMTFDSSSESIELNNGNWEFMAVAWDGVSTTTGETDLPFEGFVRCGLVENLELSGGDASLAVTLNMETCAHNKFGLASTKVSS